MDSFGFDTGRLVVRQCRAAGRRRSGGPVAFTTFAEGVQAVRDDRSWRDTRRRRDSPLIDRIPLLGNRFELVGWHLSEVIP